MDQLCDEGDLALKPVAADDAAQLGPEHLERHAPPARDVMGKVHDRHAAGAELALDLIAAGETGTECFG